MPHLFGDGWTYWIIMVSVVITQRMQIIAKLSIVFDENRTVLQMEGKAVDETIKTTTFSYFIIKF